MSIIHEVITEAWAALTVEAVCQLSALSLAGAMGFVWAAVLR